MLLKFLLLGFRSQFLYVSALVFDFPRVDDTYFCSSSSLIEPELLLQVQ